MENRIIVEIEGGLVTNVYSNMESLEIDVMYKDDLDFDACEYNVELEKESKSLKKHSHQ